MRSRVRRPSRWRMNGGSAGWPNLASTSSSWPFACWFFRCRARVAGDLECVCMKVLRDLPHTCSCTWCLFEKTRKQTNSFIGFKNQGAPKIYWYYNLISPRYLLKQGWIKIASKWVCCATLIQNLVLPFHLNSAQWLTQLDLIFLQGLVHICNQHLYKY